VEFVELAFVECVLGSDVPCRGIRVKTLTVTEATLNNYVKYCGSEVKEQRCVQGWNSQEQGERLKDGRYRCWVVLRGMPH
jgi:hypothetical protein